MPLNSISSQYRKVFSNYVSNARLPGFVKVLLTQDSFFQDTDFPEEYFYYPELFSKVFLKEEKHGNERQYDLLNIAGYLYFRSIIIMDKWMDADLKEISGSSFLIYNTCVEESMKILCSLYPENSEFWSWWSSRKEDYFKAAKFEKEPIELDLKSFEWLADCRSAHGKIAVDCCFELSLTKDNALKERVLESHRLFSIGFQILDDIQDFKKDFESKQKNICHSFLRNALHHKGINDQELDINLLHKHLYVQGIAEELLGNAKKYFSEAKEIISDHEDSLAKWINLIEAKFQEAKLFLLQLKAYEKTIIAKKYLSSSLIERDTIGPKEVKSALTSAYDYVAGLQNDDGSWEEFYLNSGLSNTWATGYILSHLPKLHFRDHLMHKQAISFLLNTRQSQLWGYNSEWIADTDSTTCALLALFKNGIDISKEVNQWLLGQKEDGGLSTYNDTKILRKSLRDNSASLDGWSQSHVCVSALGYYFISLYNRSSLHFKRIEEFILNAPDKAKVWKSYWWTSPIYASVYALLGLNSSKSKSYFNCQKTIDALLHYQNESGSFRDAFMTDNSFYTSLMLVLLTSNQEYYIQYKKNADAACKWLLTNQYSDGSWKESTCLRVPSTHVVNPEEVREWKLSNKMTNIVTTDFCRLFTTSQMCLALTQYLKVTKEEKILALNEY